MARNYAVLPHEYLEEMDCLSDAEFGRLMRALLAYSSTGKLPALSGNEKILAKRVVMQEDRYQQFYSDLAEKRSDAGKKGMASRWGDKGITADNKDNNVTPVITADNKDKYTKTETNTETNTNTNTNTEIDKDRLNKRESKREKNASRFTPPQAEEVKQYCVERENGIDAEAFIDYYTARGWKIGNQPMKDWKAAVRTWERRNFKDTHKEEVHYDTSDPLPY